MTFRLHDERMGLPGKIWNMSRTSRLFEMINVLRARRMPVTALDLAGELGVSQRSIYRDIETLRSLGALVDGQAGVGYCLKEGFFLPQFAFSPDELDALILGLGWVRQRADPALAQCSESALAKILSARSNGPVASHEPPALVTAASVSERVDPPQAAMLRDAIRRQRKVAISYEDAQGSLSDRTVWPIAIVYFDDVRVLAAWCEHRSAFRNFRVDRLHVRTISEERYPERRQSMVKRWRQQDRDWRSMLTVSDTSRGYRLTGAPPSGALSKER
jgi:predicted DNA-binding transcriptional regulator YafY